MNCFRVIVGLFRAAASLQWAVALLAIDAGVLAWATLVENHYGATAARFGIYDSSWFLGLNVALAVNVLCAMLIRLPWRRRHLGFLLTHFGILVLLAGCLISRLGGIEAHLPVYEGHAAHRAYVDASYHFELQILRNDSPIAVPSADGAVSGASDKATQRAAKATAASGTSIGTESIHVPFVAGPFAWSDYAKMRWFPWRLAYRSRGKIYDRDDISLTILDYVDKPQPRVRAVLTIDGKEEEFDLVASDDAPRGDQRCVLKSDRRRIAILMRPDEVHLGFEVFLHRFQRKLDPGSDMVSHYSSLVDFLDRGDPPQRLQENVLITLNAPIDFADPETGRAWRLFQASFSGPWTPGQPEFDRLADPADPRDQIYLSQLSVNYDPGRGVKYVGSLLIVAGIVAVYLLRTHLFRQKTHCAADCTSSV